MIYITKLDFIIVKVGEYMSLFGKALLPPDWVFGVWGSANRWNSQSDVEQLLHKLKEYIRYCRNNRLTASGCSQDESWNMKIRS